METTTHTPDTKTNEATGRLERPIKGRVLAGVAAGVAKRASISVGLVRLGFIVAAFFGGFGVLLYLAAWALMPEEGVEEAPAERWFASLNDPDRRTGAILIGIAGAIVIVSLAPITAVAVVALVIGSAVLAGERKTDRHAGETDLIDDTDTVDESEPVEASVDIHDEAATHTDTDTDTDTDKS